MTRTAKIDKAGDPPLVINDDIPSDKTATSRKFWGVKERAYRVSNPEELELSAICDLDRKKAEEFADLFGFHNVYTDFHSF